MKLSTRQLFLCALIAVSFTLTLAAFAQDPAPAAPPAKPDVPAGDTPPTVPSEPALRRLDQEPAHPAEEKAAPRAKKKANIQLGRLHAAGHGTDRISIGHDANLAAGESADAVVAVIGSATSAGSVADVVVAILGDARSTGSVGDSVVAVLGNTYVDGKVGDAVVAVLGNVELGPKADVGGDVVAVGGKIIRDPSAVIRGKTENVSLPGEFRHFEGLQAWFRQCLLMGRPLAFGPHLGWAWAIALFALVLYVLLAVLFRSGVEKCLQTFETRPGYSILTALLSVLAAPVLFVLLAITGVGLFVVPFLIAGLVVAALFGKTVLLGWLGRRITRLGGEGPLNHIAVSVLLGGILVLLLYVVPVVGIIVFKLLAWIGLGIVIYTLILGMRREKRVPAAPSGDTPPPGSTAVPDMAAAGVATAAAVEPPTLPLAAPPPVVPPTPPPAPAISAATLPRAGFWIRTAAMAIDLILLGVLFGAAHFHRGSSLLLVFLAAYGAAMWRLRGTTIGGIVCGLKVVRLDNREVDWTTAIVRALACFLSLVVAGLGFIWVVFDDEKQSWHDKIAGTTVVRVPKGVSLV